MNNIRIIPRLDIKGPNLVKGIHLEGLRVLGKPEAFAKYYYAHGADELIYQDVVASLYDRNSLHEIITRTASEIFIPLTVGGGIRTIEDIKLVLRAGADKVSLNTAVIKNPQFIKEASLTYGSSTIVVAIEAIKQSNGSYFAFMDNGREQTSREVVEWASEAEDLGAGEILITAVDRDGTSEGYDIPLIRLISDAVQIPVIAHGGAGNIKNMCDTIIEGHADAICMASTLHYNIAESMKVERNPEEGNLSFMQSGKRYNKIEMHEIEEIKNQLAEFGITCRPI